MFLLTLSTSSSGLSPLPAYDPPHLRVMACGILLTLGAYLLLLPQLSSLLFCLPFLFLRARVNPL